MTKAAPRSGETHWLPLAEVQEWDKNPRLNAEAIPKVAASIERFGFVAPVVVWREKGRLVAGHTRKAALAFILARDPLFIPHGAPKGTKPGCLPVMFHDFASETEADAYAVADNRLNELARWDVPALDGILRNLDVGLIEITGFDPSALVIPTFTQDVPSAAGEAAVPEESTAAAATAGGDPAAGTDAAPERERDPLARVIHYDIVFDNDAQQTVWEEYLRALRQRYPTDPTIAARIARDLQERPLPARV